MVRALAILALATLVGATGGFVLASSSAPEQRATSWLQVGPAMSETTAVSTLVASQELADAYVELVKTRRKGRDDFLCDFILQFEDIFEGAVEAVRPKMCAGAGVDKLTSDS